MKQENNIIEIDFKEVVKFSSSLEQYANEFLSERELNVLRNLLIAATPAQDKWRYADPKQLFNKEEIDFLKNLER